MAQRVGLCTGNVNDHNTRHSTIHGRAVRQPSDRTGGKATVQATVTAFALALGAALFSISIPGDQGASSGRTQGSATVTGGLTPNSTAKISKSTALPSSKTPAAAPKPRSSALGAGQASSTLGLQGSAQSMGPGA